MKNVLLALPNLSKVTTPALLAAVIAVPAFAQSVIPGDPTDGNMQQIPIESGEGPPTDGGQRIMPDGSTFADPSAGTPVETTTQVAVRVRMPDGKLVDIPDGADTPWYRTDQMKGYTNYYFDPANRVYVVRGDKNPENWPKKNWDVE